MNPSVHAFQQPRSSFIFILLSDVLPVFSFCLALSFFGPSQIYLTNTREFSILYADIIRNALAISSIAATLLILLTLLLHRNSSLHRAWIALLVVISVLLWIQGQFLVWNYGLFDGRPIHWSQHLVQGILDGSLWLVALVLALVGSKKLYPHRNQISAALIVLQCVSVFVWFSRTPEPPSYKNFTVDETNKYRFSSNQNVIILVLDAFQTDFFQEIINEDPSLLNDFDGFVYFRNALAGHPFTETSTMNILTGQYYDGKYTFEKTNENAYLGNSIPKILKGRGFEVDLFPAIGRSVYYDQSVASNFKPGRPADKIRRDLMYLFHVSLFRQLPTFLKISLYNNENWSDLAAREPHPVQSPSSGSDKPASARYRFSTEALNRASTLRFILAMSASGNTNTSRNVFKYYHLDLPHSPMRINEKLEYEKMERTRGNFKRQSLAAAKVAIYFLQELKRLGIYDNSLIFIIADHGAGVQDQLFVSQKGFIVPQDRLLISSRLQVNALPLFLVKQFQSKGPLRTSNAPVSLSDIPSTIFEQLGMSVNSKGRSVFKLREDEHRTRKYVSYHIYDAARDRYPALEEWSVTGYSWLEDSWHRNQPGPATASKAQRPLHPFPLAKNIQFGRQGSGYPYLLYGWVSGPSDFSWTNAWRAAMVLPLQRMDSDLTLSAHIVSYRPHKNPKARRVAIYLNGQKLDVWNVTQEGDYRVFLPNEKLGTDSQKIIFDFTDEQSQVSNVQWTSDEPGIGMKYLSIQKTSSYVLGTPLSFGKNENSMPYLTSGWIVRGKKVWTAGNSAVITIPIRDPLKKFKLTAYLLPFLARGKLAEQRVAVSFNENPIGAWRVNAGGAYSLRIKNDSSGSKMLKFRFDLPDAVEWKKTDSLKTAICFQGLVLRQE